MKKKVIRLLSYILVAALASMITLAVTAALEPEDNYAKLRELQTLIEDRFIGETDALALHDGAAEGMIAALGDRWSYYIPASEYATHVEQMENAYVGVGITIMEREDGTGFDIMVVNEGGPAEEAGLLVGDVIIAVEGQSAAEHSAADLRNVVRGKEGTFVEITVLRGGAEQTFSVERRKVEIPVATSRMLDGNVGLITIVNFDERCADETIAAIESLLEAGAQKLLFDVRYNPGGYASELVEVLDYLLPEGELFRTVDYAGRENVDTSDEDRLEIPMAVLVNTESYSAAEFFAAALSEYEAAIVVGEQTSGKGYFQYTYQLEDGSAVGLSVGKYYTPKGVSLEGVGITPDVEIPVDEETATQILYGTLEPENDPQILAALAALEGK